MPGGRETAGCAAAAIWGGPLGAVAVCGGGATGLAAAGVETARGWTAVPTGFGGDFGALATGSAAWLWTGGAAVNAGFGVADLVLVGEMAAGFVPPIAALGVGAPGGADLAATTPFPENSAGFAVAAMAGCP